MRASEKLDIPTRVRITARISEKIVVFAWILDTIVIINISREDLKDNHPTNTTKMGRGSKKRVNGECDG